MSIATLAFHIDSPRASRFMQFNRNNRPPAPCAAFILVALFAINIAYAAEWPMMGRDKTRNHVSPEENAPSEWDVKTGKNIKWKARIGDFGASETVVAGGLVWVGSNAENPADGSQQPGGILAAFGETDGKLFRERSFQIADLVPGLNRRSMWGLTGSPLVASNRVWFVTPAAEVFCFEYGPPANSKSSFNPIWRVDLTEFGVYPAIDIMGGKGICSVCDYGDFIYVTTGNGVDWTHSRVPRPDGADLLCLQKQTGQLVWDDSSPGTNILFGEFASPLAIEIDGVAQVIAPQGDGWIRSFTAETGKLIWKFDINPKSIKRRDQLNFFLNAPVFYRGRIYIAGGRDVESGEGPSRLVCLDPTRRGDISLEIQNANGNIEPNPNSGAIWHFDKIGRSMSSVAIHDDLLVAVDFGGFLYCLDAQNGNEYWRHDLKARAIASPLIADNKIYASTEDGETYVISLARQKSVIAKNAIESPIYSPLVYVNGTLYLRGGESLYAIQQPPRVTADGTNASVPPSWPQWRGPDRSNASSETGLLKEWPQGGPPLLWTATGVGLGIHSVSVANGRLYTQGNIDGNEVAFAIDTQNGNKIWARRLGATIQESPLMRWLTQRCPTVDQDRIYPFTMNGDLICLNANHGDVLWQRSYKQDFGSRPPSWGYTDHPLVDQERLICTPFGITAYIVALNKHTGETIWERPLPGSPPAGYAALMVSEACGVRQYIVFNQRGLISFAAADGTQLWEYERPNTRVGATYTPIVKGDFVLSPNGYGGGLILIKLSLQNGKWHLTEIYNAKTNFDPFQDSTVAIGDHLYTSFGVGVPACFEFATGKPLWQTRPTAGAGRLALTSANGYLYLRHANGFMTLVEANPQRYIETGAFPIPDHESSIGVTFPVVANAHLYIRDNHRLHCFDLSTNSSAGTTVSPKRVAITLSQDELGQTEFTPRPPRVGRDRAPDAVFVPTPHDVVAKMFELAQVKQNNLVVDLGSGDGRIVIAAARKFGCQTIGYEIDKRLVEISREAVAKQDLQSLVRIEHEDIFTLDLSNADVVTTFLYPRLMERLIPQLQKLKLGSRIVSHQFEIPGIKPDKVVLFDSAETGEKHRILLWTTPLQPPDRIRE